MNSLMDADRRNRRSRRTRVKVHLVAATVGAFAVVAALTLAVFQPGNESKAFADLQDPPSSTPTVPSATPTLKSPPNGGWSGGWIGTGPYHGKGWPGFPGR